MFSEPTSWSAALALAAGLGDPRALYDVLAYRLDVAVLPDQQKIAAWVCVDARVGGDKLGVFELDMDPQLEAHDAMLLVAPDLAGTIEYRGVKLEYEHERALLDCKLPKALEPGTRFCIAVHYTGSPKSLDDFDGVHWSKTASGAPFIGTSSQSTGSRFWWPSKDSFFHPEDKPERTFINATVPNGLYAVSNGRLVERVKNEQGSPLEGFETFRWRHDYPCETYAITLNVAPYLVVESKLDLPGLKKPLPFIYYVLPEDAEKAKLQFADVPKMLEVYSDAFGPFPFPDAKYALVQAPFWGMEHSTAVAYGSSFPKWCKQNGVQDRFRFRNALYDYILIHESAHEWWGNAVSARDWSDFWLHEGFATYAEGVYVERTMGAEVAAKWWKNARMSVPKSGSLYRGKGSDSGHAYNQILYNKGACVLNTLRNFIADDEAWFASLRDFNLDYRYKNATTDDFRCCVEKHTKREWKQFFDEWFYGVGFPRITGKILVSDGKLALSIDVDGTGDTEFHVPFDIAWIEGETPMTRRIALEPERNELEIPCAQPPREVKVINTERMLASFDVRVQAEH